MPKNKIWSKSGFWSNIDDFLELHRKNKIENQKSGSKKFLGIPKGIQNRCKHSLELSKRGRSHSSKFSKFRKFQDLDKFCSLPPVGGFWSNIGDFLELYRKNKTENRKSGSNKFLGIPKAIQNRSKHSLRVPELRAPST